MSISAQEYAQFPKTDAATFFGMRLAMAQAVVDVDAKRAKGERFSPAAIKHAIDAAIEKEPYLKKAGTTHLVREYFDGFDKEAMADFYGAVAGKLKPETLQHVREGKANVFELLRLGNASNASALAELHVETLTKDFQAKIRDTGNGLTKGLVIHHLPMSETEVKALSAMEGLYRTADKLDILHKPVRQLLAHVDVAAESAYARGAKVDIVKVRSETGLEDALEKKHFGNYKDKLGHLPAPQVHVRKSSEVLTK